MNQDQIGGIIRAVVPPLVTYLVAKNIIPAGDADAIIASVVTLAVAGWSIVTNKTGKTIGS
jgi:hypothetical protein